MAPPSAGVTKRRERTFVRTRAVTTPIAAYAPPPPPRLTGAGLRQSPFPLPLPQLPGAGVAARRTTMPPEHLQRHPPQPAVRTTPPVALSMPSLDMETTPPRSYAAVLNTNPSSPPHAPPHAPPRSIFRTTPTPPKPARPQPPLAPASKKLLPIVVDQLPNWPHHLRQLRDMLGHVPNARPYGKGIRFLAKTEEEYRLYQRYLAS
ncbi:uncharacterized protein LOC126381445 [Pectinophora gossypiella]|uniref:uncharacterized protein LOC126381445 n=1 Tax=Pectinophora gossypiella TaxID=13191 RepID=UPI00214E5D0F|nr:uncharacterized protein LOC126381445 [Pectinophora gossypiella]